MELVRRLVACELVNERRANRAFDADQGICSTQAIGCSSVRQIHRHADEGGREDQQVITGVAVQDIIALVTGQQVIAAIAEQTIVPRSAVQRIVVLEAIERVGIRIAEQLVVAGLTIERVRASTTMQHIGAAAAANLIHTQPSPDFVVRRVALNVVVEVRADDILDDSENREPVQGGVHSLELSVIAAQIDPDRADRAREVEGVVACHINHPVVAARHQHIPVVADAAFHHVIAGAAFQRVIAEAALDEVILLVAVQLVVRTVADQEVLAPATEGVLDIEDAAVEPASDSSRATDQHVHRDGAGPQRVIHRVIQARLAIQNARDELAIEERDVIIARTTEDVRLVLRDLAHLDDERVIARAEQDVQNLEGEMADPAREVETHDHRVAHTRRPRAVRHCTGKLASDVVRGIDTVIDVQRVVAAHALDVEQVTDVINARQQVFHRDARDVHAVIADVDRIVAAARRDEGLLVQRALHRVRLVAVRAVDGQDVRAGTEVQVQPVDGAVNNSLRHAQAEDASRGDAANVHNAVRRIIDREDLLPGLRFAVHRQPAGDAIQGAGLAGEAELTSDIDEVVIRSAVNHRRMIDGPHVDRVRARCGVNRGSRTSARDMEHVRTGAEINLQILDAVVSDAFDLSGQRNGAGQCGRIEIRIKDDQLAVFALEQDVICRAVPAHRNVIRVRQRKVAIVRIKQRIESSQQRLGAGVEGDATRPAHHAGIIRIQPESNPERSARRRHRDNLHCVAGRSRRAVTHRGRDDIDRRIGRRDERSRASRVAPDQLGKVAPSQRAQEGNGVGDIIRRAYFRHFDLH